MSPEQQVTLHYCRHALCPYKTVMTIFNPAKIVVVGLATYSSRPTVQFGGFDGMLDQEIGGRYLVRA